MENKLPERVGLTYVRTYSFAWFMRFLAHAESRVLYDDGCKNITVARWQQDMEWVQVEQNGVIILRIDQNDTLNLGVPRGGYRPPRFKPRLNHLLAPWKVAHLYQRQGILYLHTPFGEYVYEDGMLLDGPSGVVLSEHMPDPTRLGLTRRLR